VACSWCIYILRLGAFNIENTPGCILVPSCVCIYIYICVCVCVWAQENIIMSYCIDMMFFEQEGQGNVV
jgi:hypothetical protein